MSMEIDFRVELSEDQTKLGVFLRRRGVSVHLIRRLKYEPRGICVDGQRAKTNQIVRADQTVTLILPEETEFSALPQPMLMDIRWQSTHALVLNKPAGLVVHPTLSHHDQTLANGYCSWLQEQGRQGGTFRPIGRLDADTSGLVLCAQNVYAAPFLAEKMEKSYVAIAAGRVLPRQGRIEAPLAPRADSAVLQHVSETGKPAVTEYQVLEANDEMSLLRVRPLTGRTHQIRVHFAYLGHPLLGDGLYGGAKNRIQRHALHCGELVFCEPGGNWVSLASELPPDMKQVLTEAGFRAGNG